MDPGAVPRLEDKPGEASAGACFEAPLRSAPQMTSKMGKSFAQLLTRSAVLIAVGLAAVGGGRGRIRCSGAVDVRRGGCGRCGIGAGRLGGVGEGSGGVVIPLDDPGSGVTFVWGVFGFTGSDNGDGRMPGVGGPHGVAVASPAPVLEDGCALLLAPSRAP